MARNWWAEQDRGAGDSGLGTIEFASISKAIRCFFTAFVIEGKSISEQLARCERNQALDARV